jgi:hypothetical protein
MRQQFVAGVVAVAVDVKPMMAMKLRQMKPSLR